VSKDLGDPRFIRSICLDGVAKKLSYLRNGYDVTCCALWVGGTGRVTRKVQSTIPKLMNAISARIGKLVNRIVAPKVGTIRHTAVIFDLILIPRYCLQFWIRDPKTGCSNNHRSNRSDDLENAHAATRTNIVVGSPGTKIPINPNPTQIKPSERYR